MVDSIIWFFRTTVKSVGILGHERVTSSCTKDGFSYTPTTSSGNDVIIHIWQGYFGIAYHGK